MTSKGIGLTRILIEIIVLTAIPTHDIRDDNEEDNN